MKKIISLVLALVMIVACMGSLALAAELEEIAPSKAAWQVKTADGTAYYILELNSEVMEWAVEQEGVVTFTALKGGVLAPMPAVIPHECNNANIVIDLNGYSFTNLEKELASIVVMGSMTLTLKNGVLINPNQNRVIALGKSGAADKENAATVNFENIAVICTDTSSDWSKSGVIIESKFQEVHLNVKNSTLWAAHTSFLGTFNLEQAATLSTNVENSIIGAGSDRIIRLTVAECINNITITDSAIVCSTGNYGGGGQINVNGAGAKASNVNGESAGGALVEAWAGTSPDGTIAMAGKATVYGNAPTKTTIPATVTIELPADPAPPAPPVVDDPVTPPVVDDPVTPPVVDDPVTPPVVDDPVTPPADDPVTPPADEPVTPPADEPADEPADIPTVNTGDADAAADEAPASNNTLIIVIAAAAVVILAAVVVIIVKKKKA